MGLFDDSKSAGFDFGVTPRAFGEHMTRAGMTRPERILHDGNVHDLNDFVDEQTRAARRQGRFQGAMLGFAALLLRNR
jgi:hypothetical protein